MVIAAVIALVAVAGALVAAVAVRLSLPLEMAQDKPDERRFIVKADDVFGALMFGGGPELGSLDKKRGRVVQRRCEPTGYKGEFVLTVRYEK